MVMMQDAAAVLPGSYPVFQPILVGGDVQRRVRALGRPGNGSPGPQRQGTRPRLDDLELERGACRLPVDTRHRTVEFGTVPLAEIGALQQHLGCVDERGALQLRQRRLSQLQRAALVYTPQVLLQGTDFRQWDSSEFDRAVTRINGQSARASLELEIVEARAGALALRAWAAVSGPAERSDAALYVAAYENRLESRITAGENSGRILHHDHVVLEWRGPYALGTRQLDLALLPKAKIADSGVVAFVQNRRTGEVLQALSLAACTPGAF